MRHFFIKSIMTLQTGLSTDFGRIQHLRPVFAPVADSGVGRLHCHLVGVVGVQQVKRWPRIAALVIDTQPTVVVSRVQDESETVMDLRDEFIRLRRYDCEDLEVGAVRPLPCVPDAGEGERPRLRGGDGEDAFDRLRCFRLLRLRRRLCDRSEEISKSCRSVRAIDRCANRQYNFPKL
jgi:hypothetical protein